MRPFAIFRARASARRQHIRPARFLAGLALIVTTAIGLQSARADDGGAREFVLREAQAASRAAPRIPAAEPIRAAPPVRADATHAVRRHATRKKVQRFAMVRRSVFLQPLVGKHARGRVHPATQAVNSDAGSERRVEIAPAIPAPRANETRFTDRTLRKGDIVATENGLRVFLGASHFPYAASDFGPVRETGRHARAQELAALDSAVVDRRLPAKAGAAKIRADGGARRTNTAGAAPALAYAAVQNPLVPPFAAVMRETRKADEPATPRVIGVGYIH